MLGMLCYRLAVVYCRAVLAGGYRWRVVCSAIVAFAALMATSPAALASPPACSGGTQISGATAVLTCSYTGGLQEYTVPSGVSSVTLDVRGAQGGNSVLGDGGDGGEESGALSVSPGEALTILVGGQGAGGGLFAAGSGGYGGGGSGGYGGTYGGSGGGGGSFVFDGSDNLVLAAGGGGGSGNESCDYNSNTGGGGGDDGATAGCPGGGWGASPGGPGAGGSGGGDSGVGGSGGGPAFWNSNTGDPSPGTGGGGAGGTYGGGGGGGGYFGGGGGDEEGGGGASGFASGQLGNPGQNGGDQSGNGVITISYATKLTPSISTTQDPQSAPVGSAIGDVATISGGYDPSGTVTFNLYNNPSAIGTPLFTDTESLSDGSATSAAYVPTVTGGDYWVATYNGDANNNAVSTGTGSGPVVIEKASPSISTSPKPTSASVGSSIADVATVSGGYDPSGAVTFKLYTNSTATGASGTPLFTDTEPLSNGSATSTAYTSTMAGSDYWVVTYDGDADNNSALSAAVVLIGKASPSISVHAPSSGAAGDAIPASVISASLSSGFSPSGTITFTVVGPQSVAPTSCGSGGTTLGTASVPGSGTYHPAVGFTPASPGDYWWYANYGGDNNNDVADSGCGGAMSEMVVAANTLVAPAPPAPSALPVLSALHVSPSKFVLAGRLVKGRCVPATRANRNRGGCTRPVSLHITYRLNVPAHVAITIARKLPGSLVDGRCVAETHKDLRPCSRLVSLRGALATNGEQGANSFTFNGIIGQTLQPDTYELSATASISGHTDAPQTITFTLTA